MTGRDSEPRSTWATSPAPPSGGVLIAAKTRTSAGARGRFAKAGSRRDLAGLAPPDDDGSKFIGRSLQAIEPLLPNLACQHKILQLMYVITRDGNHAGPLHEGGQAVVLYVEKSEDELKFEKESGIANPDKKQRVADFSYESDVLAELIVDAWLDPKFETELLETDDAAPLLAKRGFYLSHAHIISEAEYHRPGGHVCKDREEVVLVLPNKSRVALPRPKKDLLETAKLLMAVTPNGI